MNFVKYGIIGCGEAWNFHRIGCKNNPKIKFISVYDVDEKKARRNAKIHNMNAYSNLSDFLDSDIDAALIMVPHYLHEEMVIAAAEAGKHILCEKPMAMTLEGCDEMIRATRKAKVTFMIAENHRFLPAHKYLMEAVQKGLIGKIFLVRAYEGVNEIPGLMNPGSWKGDLIKAGGGSLMDMGAHKFATLRWILKDDIISAYSWITKQCTNLKEKGEDNSMVLLKFKKGTIGEVVVSFSIRSTHTNQLELYGTKGTIVENHLWNRPVKIFSRNEEMRENRGIWYEPEIEHGPYPKYYEISARIEDSHFTDCILENKEPEFSPEDARGAIATILMSYLSVKMGKIATYDDLMEVYRTKGTKSILEGLDKVIQNNYSTLL
jgi:myo-inositol 2-dehydrogenase/D-chiro-inositol 1-dehydrogenase